jgi:hypothetical protein
VLAGVLRATTPVISSVDGSIATQPLSPRSSTRPLAITSLIDVRDISGALDHRAIPKRDAQDLRPRESMVRQEQQRLVVQPHRGQGVRVHPRARVVAVRVDVEHHPGLDGAQRGAVEANDVAMGAREERRAVRCEGELVELEARVRSRALARVLRCDGERVALDSRTSDRPPAVHEELVVAIGRSEHGAVVEGGRSERSRAAARVMERHRIALAGVREERPRRGACVFSVRCAIATMDSPGHPAVEVELDDGAASQEKERAAIRGERAERSDVSRKSAASRSGNSAAPRRKERA